MTPQTRVQLVCEMLESLDQGGVVASNLSGEELTLIAASMSRRAAIRRMDGKTCSSDAQLFKAFQAALSFPAYFGHNWDALDECLCDREFEPRAPVLLIVDAADTLAAKNMPNRRRILPRIFNSIAKGREASGYKHIDIAFDPFWIVLSSDGELSGLLRSAAPLVVVLD